MDIDTMISEAFPTRTTILAHMGFSEMPIINGVSRMLYLIIYNSLWFNDICNRYMPDYKKYFLMTTIFDLSDDYSTTTTISDYSYQRYLHCALLEYSKLSRYVLHCASRGLDLDFFAGDFHIVLPPCFSTVNFEENNDNVIDIDNDYVSVFVPFNKRKIRSIRRTRMSLLHYRNKIREQVELLQSSEMMLHEMCQNNIGGKPPGSTDDQMTYDKFEYAEKCTFLVKRNISEEYEEYLHTYIHQLENDMDSMKHRLELCRTIQSTHVELKKNLENLQKYKLIDDLHMRSIEFCMPGLVYFNEYGQISSSVSIDQPSDIKVIIQKIPICSPRFRKKTGVLENLEKMVVVDMMSILPEVLVDHIYSFIGNDTLENVRKKCVMDRYFPDGRDDVFKLLKTWRNKDLTHFSKQVFLCYDFNFHHKQWKRVDIRKSSNKTALIEHILRCQFSLTFYEFLRDVFILSKILHDRRRVHR